MTTPIFNLTNVDPSWRVCIKTALKKVDPIYLKKLATNDNWLPGPKNIFNAFSLPLEKVNYVLLGETPYPRAQSANGYAFWDAAVTKLWSDSGLSKQVNRATSLRNLIKMLLVAEKKLNDNNTSQSAIAALNKKAYVQTNNDFFQNFIHSGFLLMNACPVLCSTNKQYDAKHWQPFTVEIIHFIVTKRPNVKILFFGNIAKKLNDTLLIDDKNSLIAEHPYNLSFIKNREVIDLFKPLHLLRKS